MSQTPLTLSMIYCSLMSIQMSNVNIREWVQKRREGVQPWSEFLNWNKFKAPKSIAPAGARIVKNIEKFQSNYLFVFVGLFAFCMYVFLFRDIRMHFVSINMPSLYVRLSVQMFNAVYC